MKYEIRVRPVTRFIVSEYHEDGDGKACGSVGCGEFDNEGAADEACEARAAWRQAQGVEVSAHPLQRQERGFWWCPVEQRYEVGRIVGMRGDKMLRVTEDGVEEIELGPTTTFTSASPAE